MRFRLLTLIDITNTGARRGDDSRKQQQQQNFLTAIQTISLRSNPIIKNRPSVQLQAVRGLGFGDDVKGAHSIWTLDFEFESDSHSLELLIKDFDLVPVISNLDETIDLEPCAFLTNGRSNRNTVFIEV
jgi:hypothetical protein